MTDNTQPLALMLADRLHHEQPTVLRIDAEHAGEELRRQHARIAELEARVQELGAMARENRSRRIVELEAQIEALRAALAASPTPPAEQQAAPKAAPQQKAHHLTQALTDPENQPNQYGVEFGMSGQQMHFKIGNQLFRLAYEPDDQQEFEFMKCMLIHAFSTFTPDVKAARGEPYQDSTPHLSVGDSSFEGWYESYCPAHKADKQRARDAYAAGMGDPLVKAAPQQEAIGLVESAVTGAGGFHVRLAPGAQMPAPGTKLYTAPQPAPAPLSDREEIAMVDAAMVEMANIVPPLKRSECARLIRAAIAAQGGKV